MEVEEEEVEVSRAEEGGRLIWRAPGAGLQERRGTGGSSRCWPLSVVIWRREGNGAGWGEAGREGGEQAGWVPGRGVPRRGRAGGRWDLLSSGHLLSAAGGGGAAAAPCASLFAIPCAMAPPFSVGARHWAGWTGPARPPPAEAPLSAARLPPLPPTWGPSRCLIRQGEEAQEPPLPISSALLFFHIHFFLAQRHRVTAYRFLESCSFFFFFPFPADPSESA